jgi:hypothetical protein
MKKYLIALLLLLPALALAEDSSPRAMSPAELAADSDLVVLAQLDRVNYEKRRGFAVEGTAWLNVLVRYKVPQPIDRIRLVEEGFGDDRCYFEDVPMWLEMPRYLLFLNQAEGRNFEGNRNGCKLEVLVTRDNRYTVRWPQDGLHLDSEDEALVQELEFHGPNATIDVSEMTSIRREDLQQRYFLVDAGDGNYRYTRGILLEDFRKLLGEDNLTQDRQTRGR